jgi:hypothetical protein
MVAISPGTTIDYFNDGLQQLYTVTSGLSNSANKGSMFDSGIMLEDMPLYIQGKTYQMSESVIVFIC